MVLQSLHRRGFFHLLSANFLTQALGFGTSLLVAKFLSPVELGEVKILQSYGAIFIVLAGFGYNAAVLKRCSEERCDEAESRRSLAVAVHRSCLTTAAALLLLVVLVATGVLASSPHLARWLLVYAAVVPFAVLTSLLMLYLQARKEVKAMAGAQSIIKLQSFVVIVVCSWLWGFEGFILATIGAYAAGLVPLLRQVRLDRRVLRPGPSPAGFFQVAGWSVLANGLSIIGQYTDIFLLDHFARDRREIGFYSLATIFVLGAMQVTATVQAIATPYFSERAGDPGWVRRHIVRQQLRTTLLALAVAAATYLGALVFVPLVYGAEYRSTLVYLPILLTKFVVWSSYAILGVALFGLGFVRYNVIAVAIAIPLGVGISYVLLRDHGILGLAWGQVATAAATLAIQMVQTRLGLRRSFGPAAEAPVSTPA